MVEWYVKSYHTIMIHVTRHMWMVGDLKPMFLTPIIFSLHSKFLWSNFCLGANLCDVREGASGSQSKLATLKRDGHFNIMYHCYFKTCHIQVYFTISYHLSRFHSPNISMKARRFWKDAYFALKIGWKRLVYCKAPSSEKVYMKKWKTHLI